MATTRSGPSAGAPPADTAETPSRRSSGLGHLRSRLAISPGDLTWVLVAAGALLLAAAFAWLAPTLSHLYPSPTHDEFAVWRILIVPEPLEETRAILALGTPLLLTAIVVALSRARPSRPRLDAMIVPLQVGGVVLLVFAVLDQPQTGPLLSPDYFERYLVSAPNLIVGIVIGVLLTAVLVRPPAVRWPTSLANAVARVGGWRWLALLIAIVATAIWLLPAVNTDGTVVRAGPLASSHIPIQGEDYFAAVNGRTPLVDYISQYANLLPILVEPVLRAAGPSITSLSITLCVLSALAMVAIYGAFVQIVRGMWRALALYVPWVALSLFPWNQDGPYREFNGIYYGVFPGRYFGPFILAFLCAFALRTRRIPTYALFAFAGLVVLNNYEFGMGALLALIVALAAGGDRAVPLRRRLLGLLVEGVAGLVMAVAFVSLITLVRTGDLPDPALLTYFNRLFLRDSYGLEPMSSLGMHWLLYATYSAALLIAAVRYVRHDPDRVLTAMLAFSAILGLVTGMYFVGRSSQYQLMLIFPAWGFSLALVAWTAAGALRSAGGDRLRLRRLLIPACLALIGFGVMVAAIDRLPRPQQQLDRLEAGGTGADLGPSERFIEARTRPGEDILLIGFGPEHLIADRAGVVNVSPLNSVTSLISPAEANRSIDELEDSGGNLVIERVSALPPGGFIFGVPEFAEILRQRGFALISEDPGSGIRVWRHVPAGAAAVRPQHRT
jgi:hypothetical protein